MKKLPVLLCVAFMGFQFTHANAQFKIFTIAGNGSPGFSGNGGQATAAEIDQPYGVASDASGNIYIADQQNNRIRMINATNGTISTFAGNGTPGFSGDGASATAAQLQFPTGVAVDKSSGTVLIADCGNNRIRAVLSGTITTLAGSSSRGYAGDGGAATAAELRGPSGVAVDGSHNVFIADSGNNVVREVTFSTQRISTVVGTGASGYFGDGGQATAAKLFYPFGVAVDANSNLYIADMVNNVVRYVSNSTKIITTIAGDNALPQGFSGDGGQATAAELYYPTGVVLDGSNNLYIADSFNNRVRMVGTGGIITTVAGNGGSGYSGDGGLATAAAIDIAAGVGMSAAGNLLIACVNESRIRILLSTAGISEVAMNSSKIEVFPNPSNGKFTVTAPEANGATVVKIYNMQGEKVFDRQLTADAGQFQLDLSENRAGLYLMQVICANGKTYTSKLSIQ